MSLRFLHFYGHPNTGCILAVMMPVLCVPCHSSCILTLGLLCPTYVTWKISFGVSHKGFFLQRVFLTLFSFFFPFWQEKLRCEKIKKENFSFTILNRTNLGILSIWSCSRIDYFFSHSFLMSLRTTCLHLSTVMETECLLFTYRVGSRKIWKLVSRILPL